MKKQVITYRPCNICSKKRDSIKPPVYVVHLCICPVIGEKEKTCCVCLQDLSLLAFSAAMQFKIRRSKNTTKARCLECQYPQCACCKMLATTMPNSLRAPKTKEERDKYLCLECSYPDCMECGVPMPNWRKRPSKNKIDAICGQRWRCHNCRDHDMFYPVIGMI